MPADVLHLLIAPSAAQGRGHLYIKSIKEFQRLDKCTFYHNSGADTVQSI